MAPLIVGAMCFALLVGGLAVFQYQLTLEDAADAQAATADAAPSAQPAAAQVAIEQTPVAAAEETVVDSAVLTVQEQVAGHLDAGEFSNAIELAGAQTDVNERNALFVDIARRQITAGDFPAAMQTIRRVPAIEQRVALRGEAATQQALAGGLGADFDALIDLIQNETAGPWEEIEGIGGTISEFETGVRVNPNGLLHRVSIEELTGALAKTGRAARQADLSTDMADPSPLRMVSLTRLEREAARRLENGQSVVASMQNLAGLSEIRYVFVYPEERDIVIAGPAEGWKYNELGMAVGVESERPTLQLDDLVTLLRTFSADGMQIFGCSINPRPEGLRDVKQFAEASQRRGPLSPASVSRFARQLEEKLGRQDVVIYGVPGDSRVARVIVEADYRMKLIGVGKLDAGSQIPDYFDLLAGDPQQASGQLDALRWWLTMQYDSVLHSSDRNAFEIRGSSVLCQSENQFVTSEGGRIQTGKAEPTNRLFAANFTQHYEQLAQQDPIFADLKNVFDLAMVAALLRHERVSDRLDWNQGEFAVNGAYRPATYAVPQEVDSVVNHRVFNGKDVVVQVAGGVRADLFAALTDSDVFRAGPRIGTVADAAKAPELPAGRWWWDAK